MDFFWEAGWGTFFGTFHCRKSWDFFVGFDFGPFSINSINYLNPENPLGFVLSFMASSVGNISSLVGHSSALFSNHLSSCIHD